MKTAQDGWIYLVSDFEAHVWLVLLVSLDDLVALGLGEFLGGDDADIFFLVEDLAVGDVGLDDLLEVGEAAAFDDGVQEVVGDLVVILGEGVEHLLLLNSLDGGVLEELAETGLGLDDLAQMSQVAQYCLQCFFLGGCGE